MKYKIKDMQAMISNIENSSLKDLDLMAENFLSLKNNEIFFRHACQIKNILHDIQINIAKLNVQLLKAVKFESTPPETSIGEL